MIWFFHRGGDHLKYEIREAQDATGYELVVVGPDGVATVERFSDTMALLERSLELQRELLSDGWTTGRSTQRESWHWTVTSSSRPKSDRGGDEPP